MMPSIPGCVTWYYLVPAALSLGEKQDMGGGTGAIAPSAQLGLVLWGAVRNSTEGPFWLW